MPGYTGERNYKSAYATAEIEASLRMIILVQVAADFGKGLANMLFARTKKSRLAIRIQVFRTIFIRTENSEIRVDFSPFIPISISPQTVLLLG